MYLDNVVSKIEQMFKIGSDSPELHSLCSLRLDRDHEGGEREKVRDLKCSTPQARFTH